MRRFVLVTCNIATSTKDTSSSGIRKLKRGVTLSEFIEEYMARFETLPWETFLRGETHCLLFRDQDNALVTYAFTEYKEDDLLHAVSHLSRAELLRDLNELLPLRESVR